MNFVDGLKQYFVEILDASMYIMFFSFCASMIILGLPKEWKNKKTILIEALKFICLYVLYVGLESFFFASAKMIPSMAASGLLFTASFAILPIAYMYIFLKGDVLHKTVKASLFVASLLITSEIGRSLGFFVGEALPGNQFLLVISRVAATLSLPYITYIVRKYDLNRFGRLPLFHIIIALTLSALLVVVSLWQNVLTSGYMTDNEAVREAVNELTVRYRWLFIFISVVDIVLLVLMYLATYFVIDSRDKVTELEVQSSVLAVEKEALRIDIQNREELMKIRHDLRNQLSYVSVLLQEGKNQEATDYINSLIEQKSEFIDSFSCSNLVVSGIVNLTLTKAKIANKKIKFKVVVPPKLPFEDSDLLSLITNITDNALENFKPSDDNDAISVSIVTQQDYLRITSFNSVGEENIKAKATLKTTKTNRGHGYGTKIIKNIAKKYEGYVTFTIENQKFVCDCLINMNHKGVKNA